MERIDKGTLLVGKGRRGRERERERILHFLFVFAAILNIHMHKKDSKKALMIQKWIAFCYEMHVSTFLITLLYTMTFSHTYMYTHANVSAQCRIHPDKKMLMIFDMTGAGLAQMDMDLVRFVVNCFKIYFPNILAALLVYNMPWVLQGINDSITIARF